MSEPVNSKKDRKPTWESRLALSLPGPPIIGVAIIATCLVAVYLSFVWIFGLTANTLAYLLALLIAYMLMIPRYLSSRNLEIKSLRFRYPTVPLSIFYTWTISMPSAAQD